MFQFKTVEIPSRSDLIFEYCVVFSNRKESVSDWMENAFSDCCIGVEVDLLNELLGMWIP